MSKHNNLLLFLFERHQRLPCAVVTGLQVPPAARTNYENESYAGSFGLPVNAADID